MHHETLIVRDLTEYEDKTEGITKEVFLQNLAHFSGLLVKSHSPSCQEESLIPGRGPPASESHWLTLQFQCGE